MKAQKIQKIVVKPVLVKGWLCMDQGRGVYPISFFVSKPSLDEGGVWSPIEDNHGLWDRIEWRIIYGRSARLPKPGKCVRVRLEL